VRLPRDIHNRVQYILYRTDSLRAGALRVNPDWLTCIDQVLSEAPIDAMRGFYDQFFCKGLSCDDIQCNLFVERSTLYSWRDYFLWHVALQAARAGLLPLDKEREASS
jgi:hypothetical protein